MMNAPQYRVDGGLCQRFISLSVGHETTENKLKSPGKMLRSSTLAKKNIGCNSDVSTAH